MAQRCVMKRLANGKFRLRKGGHKCRPSKSAAASHAKKFGRTGSKAHKAHAKTLYHLRVENLKKARAAKRPTIKAMKREGAASAIQGVARAFIARREATRNRAQARYAR